MTIKEKLIGNLNELNLKLKYDYDAANERQTIKNILYDTNLILFRLLESGTFPNLMHKELLDIE